MTDIWYVQTRRLKMTLRLSLYLVVLLLTIPQAFSEGFEQRHIGEGEYAAPVGNIVLNTECDVLGRCTFTGVAPEGVDQIIIRGQSSAGDVFQANVQVAKDRQISFITPRLNTVQWNFEVVGNDLASGTQSSVAALPKISVEKPPESNLRLVCSPHNKPKQSVGSCRVTGTVPLVYTKVGYIGRHSGGSTVTRTLTPDNAGNLNYVIESLAVGRWEFTYKNINLELGLSEDGSGMVIGNVPVGKCPKRRLCGFSWCKNGWNKNGCP